MMFYTQLFTSQREPLAKIWLAAHWERKLTKANVFECNLEATVREIIFPRVHLGLRTSGHLLVGVVRIYSRKTKYLLTDCNNALVQIKIAFRPGVTDMPVEELEATLKTITLIEDFSSFDIQLPDPSLANEYVCVHIMFSLYWDSSNIDVVDHFSLNQCRAEDITLKEDFGNSFLNLVDYGDESQNHRDVLLDMNFQSISEQRDDFGDENRGLDLLDFLTNSSDYTESSEFIFKVPRNENPEIATLATPQDSGRTQTESSSLNETTLIPNHEEAFALEPVPITPNSERKRGKRKRKLVVDQTKQLSSESIRGQLADDSDLMASLEMAPPTLLLMQWKESGSGDKLMATQCSTVAAPQIIERFAKIFIQVQSLCVREEMEVMRRDRQEVHRDSVLTTDPVSLGDSTLEPEITHNAELTDHNHMSDNHSELPLEGNESEVTHPELPSEDSMFVHPSNVQKETQSTPFHTQSLLDSQDFEERKITRRTEKLLQHLRNQSTTNATFSLGALCAGGPRSQAAAIFFSLLILKKQKAIELHQRAPYKDIIATPGPKFYH